MSVRACAILAVSLIYAYDAAANPPSQRFEKVADAFARLAHEPALVESIRDAINHRDSAGFRARMAEIPIPDTDTGQCEFTCRTIGYEEGEGHEAERCEFKPIQPDVVTTSRPLPASIELILPAKAPKGSHQIVRGTWECETVWVPGDLETIEWCEYVCEPKSKPGPRPGPDPAP